MKEKPSNYQVQRSFFDRVWHQEEERAIYDLFDGEAGGIDPVKGVNPDTYRPWYRGMLRHLGGVRIEIAHFLEQADRMALKFILRGTARKSGRPVLWKGSTFGIYADGKIIGGSNYLDHLSLFAQLDLLPEQAMEDALADESLFWELEQAARRADEQGQRPDPWLIRCGVARPAQSIFLMPGPNLKIPDRERLKAAVRELLPELQPNLERFLVQDSAPIREVALPEDHQLEVLLRAHAGTMVVVDSQDRIVEMNPGFTEFVEGELASHLGTTFGELLENDEEAGLFQALCAGQISRYEHTTSFKGRPSRLMILATRIDRGNSPPLVVRGLRWRRGPYPADLLALQEMERSLLLDRLHQKLAQELAGLWVHLQSFGEAALSEVQQRCLTLVERMARELVGREHHDPRTLSVALAQLLQDYEQECGLRITLSLASPLESLLGRPALFVYRIVQEALRNVVRHAEVERAEVRLALEDGQLRGTITDQGVGFSPEANPPSGRLGLLGMRQRCVLLQGDLSISSQPGRGTRIEFGWPQP